MDAVRQAGLDIPGDVSVVGFDNVPVSAYVTPPLITVEQPMQEMGRVATEMLMTLIRGEALDTRVYQVPTRLIIRGSTGETVG